MVDDVRPVLVTGGTGTLGRALVHTLLDAGRPVRVLSRRERSPAAPAEVAVGGRRPAHRRRAARARCAGVERGGALRERPAQAATTTSTPRCSCCSPPARPASRTSSTSRSSASTASRTRTTRRSTGSRRSSRTAACRGRSCGRRSSTTFVGDAARPAVARPGRASVAGGRSATSRSTCARWRPPGAARRRRGPSGRVDDHGRAAGAHHDRARAHLPRATGPPAARRGPCPSPAR